MASSDDLAALIAAARNSEGSLSNVTSPTSDAVQPEPLRIDGSLKDTPVAISTALPEDLTAPEEAKALDPGLGFGLVVAVAIHYRQAVRGWFSRFTRKTRRSRRVAPAPVPGKRPSTRSREEVLSASRISRAGSREHMVVR